MIRSYKICDCVVLMCIDTIGVLEHLTVELGAFVDGGGGPFKNECYGCVSAVNVSNGGLEVENRGIGNVGDDITHVDKGSSGPILAHRGNDDSRLAVLPRLRKRETERRRDPKRDAGRGMHGEGRGAAEDWAAESGEHGDVEGWRTRSARRGEGHFRWWTEVARGGLGRA